MSIGKSREIVLAFRPLAIVRNLAFILNEKKSQKGLTSLFSNNCASFHVENRPLGLAEVHGSQE